jgi:hypothetical protein
MNIRYQQIKGRSLGFYALIAGLVWTKEFIGTTPYDQYLAMTSWIILGIGQSCNTTI